jgi:hypothetical protein
MSNTKCIEFLNSYAGHISNVKNVTSLTHATRPYPIAFTEINCGGASFPTAASKSEATLNTCNWYTYVSGAKLQSACDVTKLSECACNPLNSKTSFKSLYIPIGWRVIIAPPLEENMPDSKPPPNPKIIKTNISPLVISDTSIISFSDGTTLGEAGSPSISYYPDVSDAQWMLDRCIGKTTMETIAGRAITSYLPQSEECDNIMTEYCSNKGADANSNYNKPECGCFKDRDVNFSQFCPPGTTDAECGDSFQSFVPVKCFGANCAQGGYRTKSMQDIVCDIEVCQQVIKAVGDNIVISGGSTIWCGTKPFNLASASVSANVLKPSKSRINPIVIAAISLIGLMAIVVVILAIRIFIQKPIIFNQAVPAPDIASTSFEPVTFDSLSLNTI